MKTTMTMTELDAVCNRMEKLGYNNSSWLPLDKIKELEEKVDKSKFLAFALWATETNNTPPSTPQEKATKQYLLKWLQENLQIEDNIDDELAELK